MKGEWNHQNVLITEAVSSPILNREIIAEILFEKLGVPGLLFGTTAMMSLYSHGRSTGLIYEVGDGVSNIVPVVGGIVQKQAI